MKTKSVKDVKWYGEEMRTVLIKARYVQPEKCRFCKDGRFIRSETMDRCPMCRFLKNHENKTP